MRNSDQSIFIANKWCLGRMDMHRGEIPVIVVLPIVIGTTGYHNNYGFIVIGNNTGSKSVDEGSNPSTRAE